MLSIVLLFAAFTFAQNQSNGAVASSITSPAPGEIFRFGPGLVTQLDAGFGFGFTNDRWFSIGRFNAGSQNVYGLRFQLPNRSILMGYQDINDTNPRIQWIGNGSSANTNLEFRVANSFTSTSSRKVATMTSDGKTYFGIPFTPTAETLVGVDYSSVATTNRTGITVQNTNGASGAIVGFKSINNVPSNIKKGVEVISSGSTINDTGVYVNLDNPIGNFSAGVQALVSSNGSGTYGVRGEILFPSGTGSSNFGSGIYGSSLAIANRYAGFFNGNVFTTGMYLSSDKKLKEQVETEENTLEKIMELNAVTYTYKENDQLNLSKELQHGFIAQEIEEVFPELVTTIKKPIFDKENNVEGEYEYKAVNYIGLISVLTSSIQELNEKVATLENEKRENASKESLLQEVEGATFSMEQNVPNPFNNSAVIRYTLPENAKAKITIFDMTGKYIREYDLSNAKGELVINSNEIGSGMFLYSLISGGKIIMTKKMMVK